MPQLPVSSIDRRPHIAADTSGPSQAGDTHGTLTTYAAVDLGTTFGRVMLGLYDGIRVELVETGRFANTPVTSSPDGDGLDWDLLALWEGIVAGLAEAGRVAAARGVELAGIGVDSWPIDYALLGADDEYPLRNPRCYHDPRFLPIADGVYERITPAELYAVNGLQHLPFTTLFQLVDEVTDGVERAFAAASNLLLVPDVITYWLTGRRVTEVTNASTTGLLDARTRTWSASLLDRLATAYAGLGTLPGILPEPVEPGTVVGTLGEWVRRRTGLGPVPVVAVATHDTASAVVGTPLGTPSGILSDDATTASTPPSAAAYISSGTWSLVGLELDSPVLTEASRVAGFTNELGIDGTVRYFKNVSGLRVLDECRRHWDHEGNPVDLPDLLDAAAREPGGRTIVDLTDPAFLAPGDMPARVQDAARAAGQPVPETQAAVARTVLDSLATAYAAAIRSAADLAGVTVSQVHVVGGGSRNTLLAQLTADAAGIPAVTGPVEAATLGNMLVQARALGAVQGTLADLRQVVAASTSARTYTPDLDSPLAPDGAHRRASSSGQNPA